MDKRRIRFDMHALASVAAGATSATKCVGIQRCPDGLYNKAFVLSMDNGKEVVAKLPNPNAGVPYYTTASEVATMEFARKSLQTPAPRVYAWNASTDTKNNPVGAEYIVMEKIPGVQLSEIWWNLKLKQKLKVFAQIARYMRRWTSVNFSQIGSLYYTENIPTASNEPLYFENGHATFNPRFTVGPSTNREWSDAGRDGLKCNSGPWSSVANYRKAVGDREMMAVKTITRLPKQLAMLYGPNPLYQPSAEKKLEALQYYSQIQDILLPREPSLNTVHLWHNDLHDENIFVDPDSLEVQGIIDWQSTHIAPLADHCLDPSFLGYEGPDVGDNLEKPELTDAIKALKGEERETAVAEYLDKSAAGNLLHLSRRIFEAGEPHFLALLLDLRDEWTNSGTSLFPLKFTDKEVDSIEADVERAELGVRTMKLIERRLGNLWPEKGVVEHENYEAAKAALRQVKSEIIDEFKTYPGWNSEVFESLWPFDQ
ncbi:TPA_exp: Uncharacterized protein A8136_2423 [Trichophyton benhamiae CBS 112371]|uniref:Altered inheritance of mitochondria protein 9, mitochondrial n=1 Tax=Arthroderma benhamiae (strain ATCC MYA-4681 / CBS 112371) TaxID=663331 RepID=D4AM58_ARTBC|nr:uncharacterized protein ARB_04748 [Trichophyton benhamiae CBS 112371]EFE35814.1 hypothetical protein ARB_04748 [Trichophyton benhamiae CBS 112371]DAA78638.1 TPA_exp: Uncharacterized protein A8136_2423 [Trichophyton benhamiae CBS 112371]